ncbi:MAG: tetratricopeptide repeat protein [Chloroflexi bacterium]|nr:tetratricopeptide repeat protein [Chloroflexota bacterium]
MDPEAAWIIAYRGITYREMERHDEALTDFNRAVELDSEAAWIIAQRGITYREMERYHEALADFNQAIDLNPKVARVFTERGHTYLEMERYDEALADFNQAVELESDDAWTIAQRGITYRRMERYDEALADFNRALELDPENYTYLISLAFLELTRNKPDNAQHNLLQAATLAQNKLAHTPNAYRVKFDVALCYLALGNHQEAEKLYDEIMHECKLPLTLSAAIEGLEELMKFQPDNKVAQDLYEQLQAHLVYIRENIHTDMGTH